MELSSEALSYLYHHIFLPPKLPQGDDFSPQHEIILLDLVVSTLKALKGCIKPDQGHLIHPIIAMIAHLRAIVDSADRNFSIDEERLQSAMQNICIEGGTIPVYVRAQNAGLLISKVDGSVHFEGFELSAINREVLASRGRLKRQFPGSAWAVDMEVLQDPEFQGTVSRTLAKLSHQPACDTKPKVKKAGQKHNEERDTTHPKMITEFFLGGFLRSVGVPIELKSLPKNVREEVMYYDSRMPWRRSPVWLLVRVALGITFSRSPTLSEHTYKIFMIVLMCRVMDISLQRAVSSDRLHAMDCKVSRRLRKLECSTHPSWFIPVQNIIQKVRNSNNATWSKIVELDHPRHDFSRLTSLNLEMDTLMILPKLDEYVTSISARKGGDIYTNFIPTQKFMKHSSTKLPACSSAWSDETRLYELEALEMWIDHNLSQWIAIHEGNEQTCRQLGSLIRDYNAVATACYTGNPEATSIMILTILELWVACDISATYIHELLIQYDPEVPQDLLQCLVLPSKAQMDRLCRVEDYLSRRRDRAHHRRADIYQRFGLKGSFAVEHFSRSLEHQKLLRAVEAQARASREAKCRELIEVKKRYRALMDRHDKSDHQYYDILVDEANNLCKRQHSSHCNKCSLRNEATSLTIGIFEWPLPRDVLRAQSTVFELMVPPAFGAWRDATVHLLLDVLSSEYVATETAPTAYVLDTYSELHHHFVPFAPTRRIGLWSTTKPHKATHRRPKSIPDITEEDICLNNGLSYRYFDSGYGCFSTDLQITDAIPRRCMYHLPSHSSSLQQFLFRPAATPSGPPPNTVIASQDHCPDHMSLDEYRSLCSIPLGFRIQWQNILVQLYAPSIDFKKVEAWLLIHQTISQCGPADNGRVLRKSHEILDDKGFGKALVEGIQKSLSRCQTSWEAYQSLSTFISLARRLLSLTSHRTIQRRCLDSLERLRMVSFEWINVLHAKAQNVTDDSHRKELMSRATEIAIICGDTFNIDSTLLEDILGVPRTASILLRCAIVVQQGTAVAMEHLDSGESILLLRWKRLSHRSYPILTRMILEQGSECLNHAIKWSWSAYQAGGSWSTLSDEHHYWLVSQTAARDDIDPLPIHYHLVTGELLVNGLPLTRLPSVYERHPTYQRLFGDSRLEVMPSAVNGMRFSGKQKYAGFTLHFGMKEANGFNPSEDQDMMIQATKDDRTWDLIPSRLMHGHFPSTFVRNFIHWYDTSSGRLHFVPDKDLWPPSTEEWILIKAGTPWHLDRLERSLISINSNTAKVFSDVFNPLAEPLQIHTSFNRSLLQIEIELPHLQLGFYFKPGATSVQSRQFRGMSIDREQSIGTLIGLSNKLVLKQTNSNTRLVIVLAGHFSASSRDHHVRLSVPRGTATRFHTYRVDSQLGKLVHNGTMQSMLYLSYLHAHTSYHLPDPLTKRTGTEEALEILGSAAVRSFTYLNQEDIDLLQQIAEISPSRSYYPPNERVMQTVEWSSHLNFFAQHGDFHTRVRSLFDQAAGTRIFYPGAYIQPPDIRHVEPHLDRRDRLRSSTFRMSRFGAEDHTTQFDVEYSARDRNRKSDQSSKAFNLSRLIFRGSPELHMKSPSDLKQVLWTFLSRQSELLGLSNLSLSELAYDASLSLDWSTFISQYWIDLHQQLSDENNRPDKFRLMMWLASLGFVRESDMVILQTLASFILVPSMPSIPAPRSNALSYYPKDGHDFDSEEMKNSIRSNFHSLEDCPEARLAALPRETWKAFQKRQRDQLENNRHRCLTRLMGTLEVQWPRQKPSISPEVADEVQTYVNVSEIRRIAKQRFTSWYNNCCLLDYLEQISNTLYGRNNDPVVEISMSSPTLIPKKPRKRGYQSVENLFDCKAPDLPPHISDNLSGLLSCYSGTDTSSVGSRRLIAVIGLLETRATSHSDRSYIQTLRESVKSLEDWTQKEFELVDQSKVRKVLGSHLHRCQSQLQESYEAIERSIANVSNDQRSSPTQPPELPDTAVSVESVLGFSRMSPLLLLQQLARDGWRRLNDGWKHCLIQYGLAHTSLQRAERLMSYVDKPTDLIQEILNSGHTNWSPLERPETLLMEIESGILIRPVQEEIGKKMRSPETAQNATMQLNMGEGKSSVIVPDIAACLADAHRLVRVIVAKPQSKQMARMLVSKLGGLLNRRVYYMPFSRALQLTEAEAESICTVCRECMENGGILLLQPEHILSFKLMGLERMILGKKSIGRSLLKTQQFLDSKSRDIVDESDEIFNVKFELIYTMGMQKPIEHSPDRWIGIHTVLGIVRDVVLKSKAEHSSSLEVHECEQGGFPGIRFLNLGVGQKILLEVAEHICDTGINGFPIGRQPQATRKVVLAYITRCDVEEDEITKLKGSEGFWAATTKSTLLLLRGLIAQGVLLHTFGQKRWRVNYGLDSKRSPKTRLAVPYHAKDNPAPRSEFSHPEIVIIFTSLSYYYGGLENDDLFVAFEHLVNSDQADIEYQAWIKGVAGLSYKFPQLSSINLKDRSQCVDEVFPSLRYVKNVIDYFLSHLIFSKEMREFPHKLSASGWDIGSIKSNHTTGFSGTKDSHMLLPLDVIHLDSAEQRHTNALVLENLLRLENTVALLLPSQGNDSTSAAEHLLNQVIGMKPSVRVILDVGAQIIELRNMEIAHKWLSWDRDHDGTQAAVFVDDNDELCVLDRKGRIENLQTSSFAKRLDLCLVFLDEAHTRGIDLQLPEYYRAAVTLGPKVTKDRLVQACMRMRKLGKGQSLVFLVPDEINTKILAYGRKNRPSPAIDVSDIIMWAISETHFYLQQSMPLWAVQGRRYYHQEKLWSSMSTDTGGTMSGRLAAAFLEEEARTLEQLYRPISQACAASRTKPSLGEKDALITRRCREFGPAESHTASLQEEQERELSPEIEQERQIQRPLPAQPAPHNLHHDVLTFVCTGKLSQDSKAYKPAFQTLTNTSAAVNSKVQHFPANLLATVDFINTVATCGSSPILDSYQRHVQWVLTRIRHRDSGDNVAECMMIISPYEAQELLPHVKKSAHVAIHVYTPRTNLGFQSLARLNLYTSPAQHEELTLPRNLVIQLYVFSGQLYLESFAEYVEVCNFLGLAWWPTNDKYIIAADGFILSQTNGGQEPWSMFTSSPVRAVKNLMTKIRRDGQDIDKTHMGAVLDARTLHESDFA